MRVGRAWVLLVVVLPFCFSTGCLCVTTDTGERECSVLPTFDVRLRNLDASGKRPIVITKDSDEESYELGNKESRKIRELEPGIVLPNGGVTGSGFAYRASRADSLLHTVICTKRAPAGEAMNAEVTWDGTALHCVGWK